MRVISDENLTALNANKLRARDFLWIVARDRETGDDVPVGFWGGLRNVAAFVIDPDSGDEEEREWKGMGALIEIGAIASTLDIQVGSVSIRMSQLDAEVEEAIRLYDTKQAKVQIFRGLFNPETAQMVASADCRFVGFVDEVEIVTPPSGAVGYVEITCKSHTQELLRSNPATRSHEDQKTRDPDDMFFIDAAVVGEWGPMQWGPRQETAKTEKKGLFGWGNFLGFL